jgi:hypothetical protein
MGTLRGFPCPPATGLVGQSPPSPTRLLVAGPVPNSLATERGRSVREFYAASESSPSRPRAELTFAKEVAVALIAPKLRMSQVLAPARIGRRAGGTRCPDRRREKLLRPSAAGCQATTESDMGAHRAPEVARPAGGAPRSPVAAVRAPKPSAALPMVRQSIYMQRTATACLTLDTALISSKLRASLWSPSHVRRNSNRR